MKLERCWNQREVVRLSDLAPLVYPILQSLIVSYFTWQTYLKYHIAKDL
jgi:hypothetical protein